MIPLTDGTLTELPDPQLPATASNICSTDAWLCMGGVGRVPPPPNTNPGYVGSTYQHINLCDVMCSLVLKYGERLQTQHQV